MSWKILLAPASILGIVYWLLLPTFWPRPVIQVEVPSQAVYDQDVEVPVVVSAWHPNMEVWTVDVAIQVDPSRNGGTGVHAMNLYRAQRKRSWNAEHTLGVTRLSFPCRRHLTVRLPLADLERRGMIGPGTVRGRLLVNVVFADLAGRGFVRTREETKPQPFTIEVEKRIRSG